MSVVIKAFLPSDIGAIQTTTSTSANILAPESQTKSIILIIIIYFLDYLVNISDYKMCPKPKFIQFTAIDDEENQQIVTSKKLERVNFVAFLFKNYSNSY